MTRRVYLFNDTSDCHAGSRAVMRSLRFQLRQHEIIATHRVGDVAFDAAAFEAADAVVVNGEGTIHDGAPAGLFLLDMLRLGQAAGKRTLLVNAVFQERPSVHTRALRGLDLLTVREPRSADWAVACGGQPRLRVDSAADPVGWARGGKRVTILPPVVKSTTHPAAATAGWLDGLDVPYFGLDHDFADVVETLKTTELYVTGQHHGVYAAGLAGIPFVALSSNSHKIESLLEWAGLQFALCRDPRELHDRMSLVRERPAAFKAFNEFLRRTPVVGEREIGEALNASPQSGLYDADAVVNAPAFRRAVAGRPLMVFLHGPSLAAAQAVRERLVDIPACFAVVNRFRAVEQVALHRGGGQLEILAVTANGSTTEQSAEVAEFLAEYASRIAIVRTGLLRDHAHHLRRYQDQIVGVPEVPSMNGLAHVLRVNAVTGASPDVFVFGADGLDIPRSGSIGLDGTRCDGRAFRHEEFWAHRLAELLLETRWLNAFAAPTLGGAAHTRARVRLLNPDSAVTAFQRRPASTLFEALEQVGARVQDRRR